MTKAATVATAKRKGNPFQLSPDWPIIAWVMVRPITPEAVVEKPSKPKN